MPFSEGFFRKVVSAGRFIVWAHEVGRHARSASPTTGFNSGLPRQTRRGRGEIQLHSRYSRATTGGERCLGSG